MAEGEKNFTIPQFREKVIYYNYDNQDFSYPVSSTYRGILRLSPNDTAAYNEKNTVELFENAGEATEIYYEDSIADRLKKQFLKTSTSDGYLVDLRFSESNIEFDNLYAIGPVQADHIKIFTSNPKSIILDKNNVLPCVVNPAYKATASSGNITKDVVEVDVDNNSADGTYILTSTTTSSDKSSSSGTTSTNDISDELERDFGYEQIAPEVEKVITELLLSLRTIPPGSIHYAPINIQQYNKLIKIGRPNDDKARDGVNQNNYIACDYLICDGSLYRNEDFPELAKILQGEEITYWAKEADENGNSYYVKKTHINNYRDAAGKLTPYFRVPDLRRMFIKSAYLDKDQIGKPWAKTGTWLPDSRPSQEDIEEANNHVHYITSAHYQNCPIGTSTTAPYGNNARTYTRKGVVSYPENTIGTDTKNFIQVAKKVDNNNYFSYELLVEENNNKAGVLAPKNNMNEWRQATYGSHYRGNEFSWNCTDYAESANPCGFFFSTPQEFDYANPSEYTPNIGLTSEDISSCVSLPDNDTEFDYNAYIDSSGKKVSRSEYLPYIEESVGKELYGYENAPEFSCMLPLIKI